MYVFYMYDTQSTYTLYYRNTKIVFLLNTLNCLNFKSINLSLYYFSEFFLFQRDLVKLHEF